jgi:Ca2+-dependent lipid-binding protein
MSQNEILNQVVNNSVLIMDYTSVGVLLAVSILGFLATELILISASGNK